MKTGIVILNYNTPIMTVDLAQRCTNYQCIQHIIVIDNASTDNSVKILQDSLDISKSSKIDLILNKQNGGYAVGNNIGLRRLVSEYGCDLAIVSNPDIVFTESLLEQVLETFTRYPDYKLISTARTTNTPGKPICQFCQLPDYKHLFFENFYFGLKYYRKREVDECDPAWGFIDVEVVPGSFFVIKTETLKEIGYLDEGTFLYFEEYCLSEKVLKNGGRIGILCDQEYNVITSRPNSTSVLNETTQSRKYYIKSKEYYARTYITNNKILLILLRLVDQWFIFEKYIYIKIQRLGMMIKSKKLYDET